MSTVLEFVLIVAAGGAGALARYGVTLLIPYRLTARFPWGTLLINASGAFALGLVTGFAALHVLPADWRAVVGTGFLGGYTTFSTASVDAWKLAASGKRMRAAVYAFGMFVAAIAAAAAGMALSAGLLV